MKLQELSQQLNVLSYATVTQTDDLRLLLKYDDVLRENRQYKHDLEFFLEKYNLYIDHAYNGFSGDTFEVMRREDMHLDPTRNGSYSRVEG